MSTTDKPSIPALTHWRPRHQHPGPYVVRVDGPYRVVTDKQAKDFKRRPVGFTADLDQLVEGGQA